MGSTTIEQIHAREVFDSRGKPTVEVEITCRGCRPGRAIVPSGASTGQFEAHELRDGGSRLDGNGVRKAVSNVNSEIAELLIGFDAASQADLDRKLLELDGTRNKFRLGANAILGVSLAAAYASAEALEISPVSRFEQIWRTYERTEPHARIGTLGSRPMLPLPMVNMISGGLHAGRNLDFQDYLILPVGADDFPTAFDWIVSIYRTAGQTLSTSGFEGVLVGDEGGFGPKLDSNEQALELIVRSIESCGLRPGEDVAIGLDVASTHFFDTASSCYRLTATGDENLTSSDMVAILERWVDQYPIISIEDGLAEDDWNGWTSLTAKLGKRVQLIGDDLFVTNRERLAEGIKRNAGNSVLIKLNQIGTLSETLETLQLALSNGYWPVVSARSGETEDTTIADLVVATGAGQLKVGSVARSERLAKYNQLLRLAEIPEFGYASSIFETIR